MASKSVYQDFDATALKYFELESTPKYGVLTSSGIETVIATHRNSDYDKLKDIISKETLTIGTFKTKKKGFILPLCPISIVRVKAACKEHGITLTNDYEKADFIITHDNFHAKYFNDEAIGQSIMMCNLSYYRSYKSTNNIIKEIDDYASKFNRYVIYSKKWNNVSPYNLYGYEDVNRFMLTGLLVNIAYKIEQSELDVINVNTIVNKTASKQILDHDMIEYIFNLLQSCNVEDRDIAGMIIPTIDYTQKKHLLWALSLRIFNYMYRIKKNKDLRHWQEKAKIEDLYFKSAEDIINELIKEDKLDNESFTYLESFARKEIKILNRDLYTFEVKIKPEYKIYLQKSNGNEENI